MNRRADTSSLANVLILNKSDEACEEVWIKGERDRSVLIKDLVLAKVGKELRVLAKASLLWVEVSGNVWYSVASDNKVESSLEVLA